MKKLILLVLFQSFWVMGSTQIGEKHFQFGVSASAGSHIKRAGVFLSYNKVKEAYQAHATINFMYSHQGWGPQRRGLDLRLITGVMWMYGADVSEWEHFQSNHHYFISPKKKNALAFQHQIYIDDNRTSQATGTLILKISEVLVQSENDLWGKFDGADKYRTGALSVHYDHQDFSYGLKTLMWTGETRCAEMIRIKNSETENSYPAKYGYKDISKCAYSNFSHGILAIDLKYRVAPYYQYQLSLGRDSERIRNVIQNKITHDLPFIPAVLNQVKVLHVPMLDKNGAPYFYGDEQQIKKGQWFYQVGMLNKNLY